MRAQKRLSIKCYSTPKSICSHSRGNFNNFDTFDYILDAINRAKFHVDQSRGFGNAVDGIGMFHRKTMSSVNACASELTEMILSIIPTAP